MTERKSPDPERVTAVLDRSINQRLYKFKLHNGKSINMVAHSDQEAQSLINSLGGGEIVRLTRRGVPL